MSDIVIARSHRMSPEDLRNLAENLAAKLQARHGGDYSWEDDHCVRYNHGKTAEARVAFDDSELRITVKLSMLLSLMKPVIESEINRYLDENLA